MLGRVWLVLLLILSGCQTSQRSGKPDSFMGGDLALSTERIARLCRTDNDCIGFKHPCGNVIPVLKWEYDEFAKNFAEENAHHKFDCDGVVKGESVACDAGSCVTRTTL